MIIYYNKTFKTVIKVQTLLQHPYDMLQVGKN